MSQKGELDGYKPNNTHRPHCRARERVIMLRQAYNALFFLRGCGNLRIQLLQTYRHRSNILTDDRRSLIWFTSHIVLQR